MKNKTLILLLLLGIIVLFSTCSSLHGDKEIILARVADKTISVNEFIRRAEYTIRPGYCKRNNYIHRKIILNSLIAEKLLAHEAGNDLPILENPRFKAYLRGRQEQAMRQLFYYEEFYKKSEVRPSDIEERIVLSSRRYTIDYVTLQDSLSAVLFAERLANSESLGVIYTSMSGDSLLPSREVAWSMAEHPAMIDALYSGRPEKGSLIGPVHVDGLVTYIQVKGWEENPLLTEKETLQRREDVEKQLRTRLAKQAYFSFVSDLMAGKTMNLNPKCFEILVETIGPEYIRTQKEKETAFNSEFWGDVQPNLSQNVNKAQMEAILDLPLLTFKNEVWTVRRFYEELDAHPLVFRKRHIKQHEFTEQLKFAIADLLRDKVVAEEAYRRGYDQSPPVLRDQSMWLDHFASIIQRERILGHNNQRGTFHKNPIPVIESTLNPYFKTLYQKYHEEIFINIEKFETIQLSGIDSHMLQRGVPFPVMVPGFPLLTNYSKLDYGAVMTAGSH